MLDEIRHREPVPSAVRRYCCRIARVADGSREQGLEIWNQLLVVIQGQEGIVSRVGGWPDSVLARQDVGIDRPVEGGYWKGGSIISMAL